MSLVRLLFGILMLPLVPFAAVVDFVGIWIWLGIWEPEIMKHSWDEWLETYWYGIDDE